MINERIKEIAQQAKLPDYVLEYGTELCLRPHLEKFAELIAQECIIQARTQMYNDDEISSEEDPLMLKLSLASNVGVESAVEAIQQHFGVEE